MANTRKTVQQPPDDDPPPWEVADAEVVPEGGQGALLDAPAIPGTDRRVAVPAPERRGDLGLFNRMLTETTFTDDDPEATYRAMIMQILSGKTPEEVLTPVDAVSAKDIVGRPMELHGFGINTSEYDVGSPVYASMNVVTLDTGEKLVVNTGWQAILAQMIALAQIEEVDRAKLADEDPDFNFGKQVAFGRPYKVTVIAAKRANRHGSFPLRVKMID